VNRYSIKVPWLLRLRRGWVVTLIPAVDLPRLLWRRITTGDWFQVHK
jgi:hypothetical protein